MPWTRKRASSTFGRLLLEDADELLADDLALRLRIVHSGKAVEEAVGRVDVDELDAVLLAEGGDDLLGLVLAHHPVIHEHADQAVADRAVDEQRGGGRVDPAGEPADRARVADLRLDRAHLLLDHRGRRPLLAAAGDVAEEPGEDLRAVRRMDDLWVELDAVEAALGVLEGGDRRLAARGEGREARRRLEDGVAVTHPALLLGGQSLEQRAAAICQSQPAAAELARRRLLHAATELVDHQLHAVTDAQHRDAEVEQLLAKGGGALGIDRGGAAGEHQAPRAALLDPLERGVVREQLAEDPALADAPGNQLGVLAAEVEDQHLLRRLRGRELGDLTELRLRAGNGALGNANSRMMVRGGAGRFSHR